MSDVLLLEQDGNLLLTDGSDLLLHAVAPVGSYRLEGRRLILNEPEEP